MILSMIVAATENNVIGKDGEMPWRLPDESAYFRDTTLGHPVITGRKNFESMGRPLPGRLNVVITRQANYRVPDGTVVAHSLEQALQLPEVNQAEEVFIIGGQQLYDVAMPLADKLYLTRVHTKIDGDTFFRYEPDEWEEISHQEHPVDNRNKYAYTVYVLARKPSS